MAGLAKRFRQQVKQLFPDVQQRRVFWEDVFQGPIAERVLSGQPAEAERMLAERVAGGAPKPLGEVYLVGAGPGDPDLLTFRALRLMQQADVVLYDRLVAEPIIEMCRRDAERIYVGKRRADHAVPQEQINRLLIDLAKQGKRVLRLKVATRSSSAGVARRSANWPPMASPSRWCRASPLPPVAPLTPASR